MDQATFEKLLKKGDIKYPVMIFAGPEAFLKEKAFTDMTKSLISEEDRRDNTCRISNNVKELADAIPRIFSFTFNNSPRIFLIQDIDTVTAKQRRDFLQRLAQGGVPADTFIVFTVSEARTASEITANFKQQSERIDFWAPFANQLAAWIRKQTAELGAEMTPEAADLLIELVGSDLAILHQELSKLALAARGRKIDASEVKSAVAYLRQDSIFDFLAAFGQRNSIKALRCLETLLNRGEAAPKIWYMLSRQIRDFRLFHALLHDRPDLFEPLATLLRRYGQIAQKSDFKANQEKKNLLAEMQKLAETMPETLARAVALHQAVKLRHLHLALNFSFGELMAAGPKILSTDLTFKSGIIDAGATLQRFTAEFLLPQKIA